MDSVLLMDEAAIKRALTRISYEILEKNRGVEDIVLVGIKTRGEFLADRIAKRIESIEDTTITSFAIDITNYRDDQEKNGGMTPVKSSLGIAREENYPIDNKYVVLVDDVLYTGRTIRSAMDALIDLGRPKRIGLAVLIDRGHRELPIRADFVGKNIPTSRSETVDVSITEIDDNDQVTLIKED